ncbi:MAG: CHASE2 domain-containing protein [Verrucomicrobiota bacterium]|nr:CHASE2 domain-containing protein [Verrucomicrobiota bacterium]
MQRPTIWLMLVVLLLGILFLREPRMEQSEEIFLQWLLKNSDPHGPAAPLTVVEIGQDAVMQREPLKDSGETSPHAGGSVVSPLEFALFLQSALDFQPTVVAFENILKWRDRDKDQEQVFIDQAMRVPKLLLAAELTATPDPDAPGPEIPGFTQVTGKRGELVEFSGIGRQPGEEMRLIATAGFINLPEEIADGIHVPLLFRYRGEVIPSFAFEAILLWLRVTPAEVTIDLGSRISLPHGRTIPIRPDGTVLISPNAGKKARHLSLNELLVAAQQHDAGKQGSEFDSMRDQIVLARTPANPLSPPDVFAATLATIQTGAYAHRVSLIFDCVLLLIATTVIGILRNIPRVDLVLGAIAFTAAYCLIALAVVSRWLIWLPGVLPLGTVWLLVIIAVATHQYRAKRPDATTIPPPLA